MDTSRQALVEVAGAGSAPKRQRRSVAEKRRIVEETLVEGASVARVARAHGVNANQVFYWRKLYRGGRLGKSAGAIKLLPVTVEASPSAPSAISGERSSALSPGTIHIKLNHTHIRIEGSADPVLLRTVLELLRG